MKNIFILLISVLFLSSCGNLDYQDTRPGYIVSSLSKKDKVAISDGSDIFLVAKDSTINDSTKLRIFFATKKVITDPDFVDVNYHTGLFTVYKCGRIPGLRGPDSYYFYVTDGDKSIELQSHNNELVQEQKVFVIYRGEVTFPTYKTIK